MSVKEEREERSALDLVQRILSYLSDRAGIPEWLGSPTDVAAKDVANDLVRDVVLPWMRSQP